MGTGYEERMSNLLVLLTTRNDKKWDWHQILLGRTTFPTRITVSLQAFGLAFQEFPIKLAVALPPPAELWKV